jgi:RNA-splicing ligase RtcB
MLDEIAENMGIACKESFTTIHNHIDTDAMILRKGSVSARMGETLVIPMNMRDGSLICTGNGNPDWNFSAPHGAGRLMSRSQAMYEVTVDEFGESIAGIYATSVGQGTLEEIVKPVYNFKASNDVPEGEIRKLE